MSHAHQLPNHFPILEKAIKRADRDVDTDGGRALLGRSCENSFQEQSEWSTSARNQLQLLPIYSLKAHGERYGSDDERTWRREKEKRVILDFYELLPRYHPLESNTQQPNQREAFAWFHFLSICYFHSICSPGEK